MNYNFPLGPKELGSGSMALGSGPNEYSFINASGPEQRVRIKAATRDSLFLLSTPGKRMAWRCDYFNGRMPSLPFPSGQAVDEVRRHLNNTTRQCWLRLTNPQQLTVRKAREALVEDVQQASRHLLKLCQGSARQWRSNRSDSNLIFSHINEEKKPDIHGYYPSNAGLQVFNYLSSKGLSTTEVLGELFEEEKRSDCGGMPLLIKTAIVNCDRLPQDDYRRDYINVFMQEYPNEMGRAFFIREIILDDAPNLIHQKLATYVCSFTRKNGEFSTNVMCFHQENNFEKVRDWMIMTIEKILTWKGDQGSQEDLEKMILSVPYVYRLSAPLNYGNEFVVEKLEQFLYSFFELPRRLWLQSHLGFLAMASLSYEELCKDYLNDTKRTKEQPKN